LYSIDEDSKKILLDIKLKNYVELDLFSKNNKQTFMILAPLDNDNDKELIEKVLEKEKNILNSLKNEKILKEKKNFLELLFYKNDIEINLVQEYAETHESANEENKIFLEFQKYLYHKYVNEKFEMIKTEKRIERIKNLKDKDILKKKEIIIPEKKEQKNENENIIDFLEKLLNIYGDLKKDFNGNLIEIFDFKTVEALREWELNKE